MNKRYAPNWRKLYQFEEFGDFENYFIELCYVCWRRDFKSALGEPLTNKTAINGNPIFGNENIDFAKYRLLSERVEELEDGNVGLLKVVEIYGYAPTNVYRTYSAEPVQQFGLTDPSGYLSVLVDTTHLSTYDAVNDEFKIFLQDVSGLAVGDLIQMDFVGGGTYNNARGPEVAIREIGGNSDDGFYVITPAFEASFYRKVDGVNVGTLSKQETAYYLISARPSPSGTIFWGGTRNFVRAASTRSPRMIITTIFNGISFSTEFPQLEGKFIVSSGTDETDTITTTTTPNVSTWKQMIADGDLIVAQDAQVDEVFPTTLYRKTVKRIRAR